MILGSLFLILKLYLILFQKEQVHFLMLAATGSLFTVGAGLFVWDFFRRAPNFQTVEVAEESASFRGTADAASAG